MSVFVSRHALIHHHVTCNIAAARCGDACGNRFVESFCESIGRIAIGLS